MGQNSSSNSTTRGVRDTLKCELGKKEVCTPNVVLISESRVHTNANVGGVHTSKNMDLWKARVTNGSDNSGDLSFSDARLLS